MVAAAFSLQLSNILSSNFSFVFCDDFTFRIFFTASRYIPSFFCGLRFCVSHFVAKMSKRTIQLRRHGKHSAYHPRSLVSVLQVLAIHKFATWFVIDLRDSWLLFVYILFALACWGLRSCVLLQFLPTNPVWHSFPVPSGCFFSPSLSTESLRSITLAVLGSIRFNQGFCGNEFRTNPIHSNFTPPSSPGTQALHPPLPNYAW